MLRPHGTDSREGGHSTHDPLPTFIADFEAKPHDPCILPHLHSKTDMDELFPTIPAAAETCNAEDFGLGGDDGEVRAINRDRGITRTLRASSDRLVASDV